MNEEILVLDFNMDEIKIDWKYSFLAFKLSKFWSQKEQILV